jgi:hypothetical protein
VVKISRLILQLLFVERPLLLALPPAELYSAVGKPRQAHCAACEELARELRDAWRSDTEDVRARFHQTAKSASRQPEAFRREWVMSLARMPDDEFDSLQCARYPRVAVVWRRWKEHAALSGHPGLGDRWRGAFIFDSVFRSGYFSFGTGRRDVNP